VARPKKNRIVADDPTVSYFKPRGIPLRQLEEVQLSVDEMEALRLADFEKLSQAEAGQKMGVSRATFGRIVERARHLVADALVSGKAIRVEGGHYQVACTVRRFICHQCEHQWTEPCGTGRPQGCPACGQDEFHRILDRD
jgi:predicted DNA-binding protein (UPF0251 family)